MYSGRSYPDVIREQVLDLAHARTSQHQIATEPRVSRGYVQKVLEQYNYKNISIRSPRTSFFVPKVTNEVLEFMSVEKIIKPTIYASELRDRLLLDGVVDADDLPSASQINKRMRRDLVMSKKKVSVILSESNTPQQIAKQEEYLNVISTFKPHQIHFFDEASVIKQQEIAVMGTLLLARKQSSFNNTL